jgi:hypothetical protein
MEKATQDQSNETGPFKGEGHVSVASLDHPNQTRDTET